MKENWFQKFYKTLCVPYSDRNLALYTKTVIGILLASQLGIQVLRGEETTFLLFLSGMTLLAGIDLAATWKQERRWLDHLITTALLCACSMIFQQGYIGHFSAFFLLIFSFSDVFALGIVGSAGYNLLGFAWVMRCLHQSFLDPSRVPYDRNMILRYPYLHLCIVGIAYIIMYSIQSCWLEKQERSRTLQTRIQAEKDRLAQMSLKVITAMYEALSSKVPGVDQHCEQVASLTREMAQRMGLAEAVCQDGYYAGLLHEVGTVGLPDSLLNRQDLTEEQFQNYKTYVERGYRIVQELQIVDRVAEAVRFHREHYDGSGYLRGLRGEEIPLLARILAVADYTDRHQRRGEENADLIAELQARAGSAFDPICVRTMMEILEEQTGK